MDFTFGLCFNLLHGATSSSFPAKARVAVDSPLSVRLIQGTSSTATTSSTTASGPRPCGRRNGDQALACALRDLKDAERMSLPAFEDASDEAHHRGVLVRLGELGCAGLRPCS